MLPTKIKVENYRSLEDKQRLDLRPLTLLFGKNNAGKSALLRALPIIGDSLSSKGMSPIDMDSPAVRGARFQDLKWRGEGRSATIDFRLEWEGKYIQSYEVNISYEENWNNRIAPRLINIETREKDFHLTCEFNEEEELEEIITFRDITNNSQERQLVNLNWSGMTPTCQKEGYADLFEALGTALEPMTGGVQWLTSARQAPERRSIPPGGASARLGPRGKGVVNTLWVDENVLADASSWYEDHLSRRLNVMEEGGMLRTTLETTESAALDVDMVDCGEGFIQVLPVITALAMLRHPRSYTPGILAVEEPESHLHPRLQRALAKRLCGVASEITDRRIVLETHSEHLLLGLQIAILKGDIDPEDIAVHWIEQADDGRSSVRRAYFNEDAELDGSWPPSVYGENTDMSRKIWDLQHYDE
jgi:predicted ATPase